MKLSNDHIPSETEESRRVYAAGGTIEHDRVNGSHLNVAVYFWDSDLFIVLLGFLAMTRALGDFSLKNNHFLSQVDQIVSGE